MTLKSIFIQKTHKKHYIDPFIIKNTQKIIVKNKTQIDYENLYEARFAFLVTMNIKYHQTLVIEKNILTLRLIIIFFCRNPSLELKYNDFLAPLSYHGPENKKKKKKRTLGTWKMRTPTVIAIKITPLAIKLRGDLKDYAVFS